MDTAGTGDSRGKPPPKPLSTREDLIVATLGIDKTLLRLTSGEDLGNLYTRWLAATEAIANIKNVTWNTTSRPTQTEVTNLFISKSRWHNPWERVFKPIATKYPLMRAWLERIGGDDGDDGPKDAEVWGSVRSRYTMEDLRVWVDNDGEIKKEEKVKGKDKDKKKKKATSALSR